MKPDERMNANPPKARPRRRPEPGTKPDFFASRLCTQGGFCGVCRDLSGGRPNRTRLAGGYALPLLENGGPDVDFACVPRKLPWGHAGAGKPLPPGPGAHLQKILARLGIEDCAGCKCLARAREMDRNGVEWCAANLETIVGWLRDAHKRCKLRVPFVELAARGLVRLAIRRARKERGRR